MIRYANEIERLRAEVDALRQAKASLEQQVSTVTHVMDAMVAEVTEILNRYPPSQDRDRLSISRRSRRLFSDFPLLCSSLSSVLLQICVYRR